MRLGRGRGRGLGRLIRYLAQPRSCEGSRPSRTNPIGTRCPPRAATRRALGPRPRPKAVVRSARRVRGVPADRRLLSAAGRPSLVQPLLRSPWYPRSPAQPIAVGDSCVPDVGMQSRLIGPPSLNGSRAGDRETKMLGPWIDTASWGQKVWAVTEVDMRRRSGSRRMMPGLSPTRSGSSVMSRPNSGASRCASSAASSRNHS